MAPVSGENTSSWKAPDAAVAQFFKDALAMCQFLLWEPKCCAWSIRLNLQGYVA